MQALAETAWMLLTDPNISYLLLVLGVWSVVLAVSLPGTGLPESMAVVCFALAAVGLINLPVNLVGLGLIGVALVLFVLEFQAPTHGALLLGGAMALGVGALLLFRVEDRSQAQLSWVTIIGAPLVTTALFGFVIRRGLAAQRAPAMQDLRRLIGTVGVARTDVEREGSVQVDGELWSASAERLIRAGTDVVVVERHGLVLKVAPAPEAQPAGSSPPPGGASA
jgi:membrane-bound serine protease (ClpP class)